MRVAILFDHFGPYHLARLRGAAATGIEVTGLEVRKQSREYLWESGRGSEALEIVTLLDSPDKDLRNTLRGALDSFRPEVLAIPGWSGPAAFLAMREAADRRIPTIVMSESTTHDETRSPWRECVKRRYLSLASAALAGGAPHRAYLRQLGMPDDRIFEGYDAVDNDHFARESARWRDADGPQAPYFLASNRFIPKKNLFRLLKAYARYRNRHNQERRTRNEERINGPWPLVLLGDGELKPALLEHAESLGLTLAERAPWEPPTKNEAPETKNQEPGTKNNPSATPAVFFPGFRQIDELPRFYAHAGTFVHASTTEQWGLVVNEAMASGLPVIVSERCGCAPDLVKDGENGWNFDPLDEDGLAGLLGRTASMPDEALVAFGEASRRIVSQWGPERFGSGLLAAARKAVETGPLKAGPLDRLLLHVLAGCRS